MAAPHFRVGVVIVVARPDGQVLAFERGDIAGQWQLPQGGLESGESITEGAWRELSEETGLGPDDVRLVGEHPGWTLYEFPERHGDRFGQVHRWCFFETLHESATPVPDGREFVAWKWCERRGLIDEVVSFKRPAYQQVLG